MYTGNRSRSRLQSGLRPRTRASKTGPSVVNVPIPRGEGGLSKDSVVVCSQIRTVDEIRFGKIYGQLSPSTMKQVDAALRISLQLQ
jgi:mRNA-degrading endonuclease toxin of MazEF toxin-antitoxin module